MNLTLRAVALCALLLLLTVSPPGAQALVTATERGLTIRAVNVDVAEVIRQLSVHANLDVVGADKLTGRVTIEVNDVSLPRALEGALKDFNFVVSFRELPSGVKRAVVRIHSRRAPGHANDSGPILLPTLENVRLAELQAATTDDPSDPPDPDDPDNDPDEAVLENERELAEREAAGDFAREASPEDLAILLDDDNPLVRLRTLRELHVRDPKGATSKLVDALADDDWHVSEFAIQTLGRMTSAESLQAVGRALTKAPDLQLRVRAFMVVALRADEPTSLQYVKAVSGDGHELIRQASSEFLAEVARRRRH